MAEKEVLEIEVESSRAEAALTRYNQLLNQHDSATEKAAASSSKLDQALVRNNQAFDNLANRLRSAGGAITDTFNKLENAADKVGKTAELIAKHKNDLTAVEAEYKKVAAELGKNSVEAQSLQEQIAILTVNIERNEAALERSSGQLEQYAGELGTLISESGDFADVNDEFASSLADVVAASQDADGALSDLASAQGDLASTAEDVASGIDDIATAADDVGASASDAASGLDDVTESIESVANSGGDAAASLNEVANAEEQVAQNADKAAAASEKVASAQAKTAKAAKEGSFAQQALSQLFAGLGGPLAQIIPLYEQFNKAQQESGDGALQTTSSLATISGVFGKFALGAGIFTAVTAAIKDTIDTTKQYATAVSDISSKTGEGVEFISGLAEAADDAAVSMKGTGVELEAVGGALTRFSAIIGRGVDENGQFTEANARTKQVLRELGVEAEDSTGRLKSLQDLLPDIAAGFAKLGPGVQATSLARQLGLEELLPLLLKGRDGFKDLASAIDPATVDAVKNLAEQEDALQDALRDLKVTSGGILLPAVTNATKGLNEGLRYDQMFVAGLKKALSSGDFADLGKVYAAAFAKWQKDFEVNYKDQYGFNIGKPLQTATSEANKFNVEAKRLADQNFLKKAAEDAAKGINFTTARLEELKSISRETFIAFGQDIKDGVIDVSAKGFRSLSQIYEQASGNYKKLSEDQVEAVRKAQEAQDALIRKTSEAFTQKNAETFQGLGNITQDAQLLALGRNVVAMYNAQKASELLAQAQGLLAQNTNAATAQLSGQVGALDKFGIANQATAIASGKLDKNVFVTSQAQKLISTGLKGGSINQEQAVAAQLALASGDASFADIAALVGPKFANAILKETADVLKTAKVGSDLAAQQQDTSGGNEAFDQIAANRKVPIVRSTRKVTPGNQITANLTAAQQNLQNLQGAQSAIVQAQLQSGATPEQASIAAAALNTQIQQAQKQVSEAQSQVTQLQKTVVATGQDQVVAAQAQLSNTKREYDTKIALAKEAKAGQDVINKLEGERNEALKKQQTIVEETAKGVSASADLVSTSSTVVGGRRVGEAKVNVQKQAIQEQLAPFGIDANATRVDLLLNIIGAKDLDAAIQKLKDAPNQKKIDVVMAALGVNNIDAAIAKLEKLPDKKSLELAFEATGADNINTLIDRLINPKGEEGKAKVKVAIEALGAKDVEDAVGKLKDLKGEDIQFALKVTGSDDVEGLQKLLLGLPEAAKDAVEVKVDDQGTEVVSTFEENTKRVIQADYTAQIKADTKPADESLAALEKEARRVSDANYTALFKGEPSDALNAASQVRSTLDALPTKKTINIEVVTTNRTVTVTEKCFARGTPIATLRGYVPIEQIQPGDEVYAFDHEQGKTVAATVKQTFTNHAEWMCHLMFFSGVVLVATLTCTPGHPVWSENRQDYVPASDLLSGELVRDLNGDTLVVGPVFYTLGAETFNFEVDEHHNYFAAGILVHNASERVDRQIAGLVGSLSRLQAFGAPGAYESAQRMISHTLLPQTVNNQTSTTKDNRIMQLNAHFEANSPQQVEMAFDVMQSMAEAR